MCHWLCSTYSAMCLVDSSGLVCCKQMTAYEMRISDWSSDVSSSDLLTMDQGAMVDAFSGAAARARRKIWPVHVLHTGHLPQVTMPATLADLLIEAALASQPY